jgi:DNA-binding PadR family transcriptional regulator
MTSQVNWVLLGLLIESPDYGYRLMRRFESAFGDVLSLGSESHIYTALSELKRRGLIEKVPGRRTVRSGADRQRGPRYRATTDGTDAYRAWLLAQIWEDRRQSQLFARQLAILASDPDVALEILEQRQRACLRETTRTGGAGLREDPYASRARALAERLVAEENRLAMQSALPWIDYARGEFEALRRERPPERTR